MIGRMSERHTKIQTDWQKFRKTEGRKMAKCKKSVHFSIST